jgi:hypothetical protein
MTTYHRIPEPLRVQLQHLTIQILFKLNSIDGTLTDRLSDSLLSVPPLHN